MTNEVVNCVHTLVWHSKLEIGSTFRRQYGTDIIYEPIDEPVRALENGDSDYNLEDEDANTYDSDDNSNYDHGLYFFVSGVTGNNPTNNHQPLHQQQEDEENMDERIEYGE